MQAKCPECGGTNLRKPLFRCVDGKELPDVCEDCLERQCVESIKESGVLQREYIVSSYKLLGQMAGFPDRLDLATGGEVKK